MDKRDKLLLDYMQINFAIVSKPYKQTAEKINISQKEVIDRLKKLYKQGIIRRIGVSLDYTKLGYKATLVAVSVDQKDISKAVQLINKYVNVTHNYLRKHKYNIWFTLIAASNTEINRIIREIKAKLKNSKLLNLPAEKFFKLNTNWHFSSNEFTDKCDRKIIKKETDKIRLSKLDKKIINTISKGLVLAPQPFKTVAKKVAVSEQKVIELLKRYKKKGIIRKIGIVLNHNLAGYKYNLMCVWKIPKNKIKGFTKSVFNTEQISHCYLRRIYADWKYNMFTMIHSKTKKGCENIVQKLASENQIKEFELLYTLKELKKTAMIYF